MKLKSRKQIGPPFNQGIKPAMLITLKKPERVEENLEEQRGKIMKVNKLTRDLGR